MQNVDALLQCLKTYRDKLDEVSGSVMYFLDSLYFSECARCVIKREKQEIYHLYTAWASEELMMSHQAINLFREFLHALVDILLVPPSFLSLPLPNEWFKTMSLNSIKICIKFVQELMN